MRIHTTDILKESKGLLIHGVNAQRVMASGIARQIRDTYPEVYDTYMSLTTQGEKVLGQLQVVKVSDDLHVGNAFTQLHYGKDGKRYASVDAVAKALERAFKWCLLYNQPLLAPKIGCGLGGLDWDSDVEPIFKELEALYPEVEVHIFDFNK